MTSRRPMTRSFSANGRLGSQNGEDVPASSGWSDGRNYLSNVRPENRSTLCTVMAQLTEETQPCFETTIKSKAVSETCNVKFSCVVTGYPAPELTWYKDDMELDRYCGLPKYEIFRNGKNHTLHIYNCTEEDAAIYQASARNSKGIVSCSGVLEVGTMSEFMIHQRFFAKLKQKAEKKRRDLEESRLRGKENIQKEQLNVSNQERLMRKRRSPAENEPLSASVTHGEENVPSQEINAEEQPSIIDDKSEDITVQASLGTTELSMENGDEKRNHICDTEEVVTVQQSAKEKLGEKKMRIANGFNEPDIIQTAEGIRKQDGYEGKSLAKYLTESVQSQSQSDEQPEEIMEVDVNALQKEQEKELEKKRERLKEEERERSKEVEYRKERERERERIKQIEQEQKALSISAAKAALNKEPDHQHKSAITSVFHSLKDIFFGKSKKSTETAEATRKTSGVNVEKETTITKQEPDTKTLVPSVASEQDVPKLVKEPSHQVDLEVKQEPPQQTQDPATSNKALNSSSVEHTSKFNAHKPENTSHSHDRNIESIDTTLSLEEPEMPRRAEEKKDLKEVPQISHSPVIGATDDHTKPISYEVPGSLNLANPIFETKELKSTYPVDEVMQGAEEMHILGDQGGTAAPLTDLNMADLESMQCCESQPESQLSQLVDSVPLTVHTDSQSAEPMAEESKKCDLNLNEKEIPHIKEERVVDSVPLTVHNEPQSGEPMAGESKKCDLNLNEKEIPHIEEERVVDSVPLTMHKKSQSAEPMAEESKKCDLNLNKKEIPHMEDERVVKTQEGSVLTEINKEIDGATEGKSSTAKENEVNISSVINTSVSTVDVVSETKNDKKVQNAALLQDQKGDSVSFSSESTIKIDIKPDEKSVAALDVSLTENKEVGVDSASANDYNREEDKKDKNMPGQDTSVGEKQNKRDKDTLDKTSEKVRNDTRNDKKGNVSPEEQRDAKQKMDKVKISKNVVPEPAASIVIPEVEMSKNVRRAAIEVLEIQPRPYQVSRSPKILNKAQAERRLAEKDQSATQPIIILPDTRETVIKNVAKKRAIPLIPEIKVTLPERVKREEPTHLPRNDILKLEPERVMQPITQEVAQIFRESERPADEATRTSSESAPNNVVVIPETSGVTRHILSAPSGERAQEVKPQNLDTRVRSGETQGSISNGRGREDDNSIPIINIACADDNATTTQQVQTFSQASLPGIVISKDQPHPIPPISVTNTDNSLKRKEDSKSETDQVTVAASEKPKEQLRTQLSPDISTKNIITSQETDKSPLPKDTRVEPEADRLQRDKSSVEKLGVPTPVGPTLPPLSPASLRRLMAKNNPNLENQGSVSAASVDGNEKKGDESGGSTPTSTLSCESSPKMKRRDSLTLIPSATPEELASGARRKIYLAKTKSEDEGSDTQGKKDSSYMSPSQARRAAFLQLQSGQQTPPEKRSPLTARRKATLEVPKPKEESTEVADIAKTESKPAEKEKLDPFKAPQVIRKIRGETFSDASGHLKLWCQFFNVLSDSTIKWYRDEEEIVEMERRAGDESQVALALVQVSSRDCGVYGCSIKNEYGTDVTDYLLSADILAEFFLRDDLEVGEEIEMTPMMFTKGLADSGYWGEKLFGRIMTEEVQIGEGCVHKTCRVKAIYGLNPVFESGSTCITKVKNPIAYGAKEEGNLAEKNLEITKQECKIQNTVREYCKIFAAEARVIENFGFALEVIPLHLMYRPANTIPYATVEADLKGEYLKYCLMDGTERFITRGTSEVEQKCCTFQHWIHQWTNGNLLVTRLEGVDAKITSIAIATKSKGYQGLTDKASPKIMEQFITQHQCNYYCGLLGLRPLKPTDSLQQPKIKTSRSPLLARRGGSSSSSPQLQKKGNNSPQSTRKGNSSPKVAKKTGESGESSPAVKHKAVEVPKPVKMR
ncbi:alpha-protein kinase 3 isoform X2 [Paramisgurnus dabryanus]|uniref:alpha-protein kinase 3 isoform X2 n=1 Tax=Paramisgurnus dabryanus TaxID=90735 RepID=UPI0031F37B5B